MIRWHRLCAAFAALLLGYIVLTGAGIQLADMRALVTHAPATDPDMLKMREHINGTPNYAVVSAPDYGARALPADLDLVGAVRRAAALGRRAAPGADLRFVELRMVANRVVGHVRVAGERDLLFDRATGTLLAAATPVDDRQFSTREWFKAWHQSRGLGHLGTVLNGLAGIALGILMVTGLVHYARLYRMRRRSHRPSPFWQGGSRWRSLHRSIALASALPIAWIVVSGFALSLDNVGAYVNGLAQPASPGPNAFDGDFSTPIADDAFAPMARITLAAFHAAEPGVGIKVLRLRTFAGYRQGVIVAADAGTSQRVYNATDGVAMTMSEPGYPPVAFPFGWEWHQRLKRIHRGDILGMTGRWLGTAGALALVYLVLSGVVMYVQLWRRRKRSGRGGLVWR